MRKPPVTREAIIEKWKELDAAADAADRPPVGAATVALELGISQYWIWQLFPGESLTTVKMQNGIRLSPQEQHRSGADLLALLDQLVTERGNLPSWNVLIHKTGISEKTWKKTLGGREGCPKEDVFRAYRDWLRSRHFARFVESGNSRAGSGKACSFGPPDCGQPQ
jgi:hypothetical protein